MTDGYDDGLATTRIPADIARPDRVLGPLTARQTAILAGCVLVLYGGYWLARPFMPPLAYLVMVVPVAGAVTAVAVGAREGIGLDRFLLAALAHARAPRRRVHAPEGVPALPEIVNKEMGKAAGPMPVPVRMPYRGVGPVGTVDLAGQGQAALGVCSPVNFDLHSGAEQQGLVAGFGRWLNSLTGPTQLLLRCHRTDLAPLVDRLHHGAPALPHPALERAARAHADYLAHLAGTGDLLTRQIVLVAREETPPRRARPSACGGRAVQRLQEATGGLAPAGVSVTPLDPEQTTELITGVCNPDPPTPPLGAEAQGVEA
ncbi:PrgI family protein [Streptomyces malaysiensis subsp. malaysiensis]|uniref:PrgI family mobile element protein n=1 Tax=Streptomyces malaysiensis TaxID=92644 RepID=UPI0024BFB007|nr:PrgI family protein [Streptomyces sp. NA07423]WHX17713.1 PrgI family protein [Streptomyces sp. NA07423]